MRFILISDTHCRLRKIEVPEGDLILHAGDLTFKGNHQEIYQELRELGKIAKRFKHGCIFIAGNHDRLGEQSPGLMKQMAVDEGLTYLDHSSVQIENFNIFGSAYTPAFCNWAFQLYGGEAKEKWAQIPDNTNILITHGPPKDILDIIEHCDRSERLGCRDLYNRTQQLKQLKLHIFGHIHSGYGRLKIGDLTYVNASVCTEQYKPINKPIVVEL